jgi:hypothetical protein
LLVYTARINACQAFFQEKIKGVFPLFRLEDPVFIDFFPQMAFEAQNRAKIIFSNSGPFFGPRLSGKIPRRRPPADKGKKGEFPKKIRGYRPFPEASSRYGGNQPSIFPLTF